MKPENEQNPAYEAPSKFYEPWGPSLPGPKRKVPAELAYACQREYLNREPVTTGKSHYIEFKRDELKKWFDELEADVDYNLVRIYLGVYPDARLPQQHPEWKNKLTVFLIPYQGIRHANYKPGAGYSSEQDVEAFNMGEIYP